MRVDLKEEAQIGTYHGTQGCTHKLISVKLFQHVLFLQPCFLEDRGSDPVLVPIWMLLIKPLCYLRKIGGGQAGGRKLRAAPSFTP